MEQTTLKRKFVRWIIDNENDIGISLAWDTLILVKYKYSTIVQWFVVYDDAPKYH